MHFVCIHAVYSCSSMDAATACKEPCFILSDRLHFHMINNLSNAFHTFTQHVLTSLPVDEMLPPKYIKTMLLFFFLWIQFSLLLNPVLFYAVHNVHLWRYYIYYFTRFYFVYQLYWISDMAVRNQNVLQSLSIIKTLMLVGKNLLSGSKISFSFNIRFSFSISSIFILKNHVKV